MDLLLAHGASGNATSMQLWVRALAALDIEAVAVDLPKGRAERAVPVFRTQLKEYPDAAIGGHSYGGRVGSLLAAEEPVRGLVLLSYPLHRPGHPEDLRTEHWPLITCRVLVLSGESDQFATISLLRQEFPKLARGEMVTYPKIGHGIGPVMEDAAPRIASFVKSLR